MKKKMGILIFSLLFCLILVLPLSAEPDEPGETEPPVQTEEQQTPPETGNTAEATVCLCGRPIYTENGQGYSKYDCTKCRQNYLLCQCDCWCGNPTHTETDGEGQPKYCDGCGLLCPECTCADREMMLKREKDITEGTLSTLGLQKPSSAAAISVVTVLMIAALCFALTTPIAAVPSLRSKPSKKKPEKPKEEPPKKPKIEGRAAPIPVDIKEMPLLEAYEAAEEWINRNIRKRNDLLADFGAERLTAGQYAKLKILSGLEPNDKCPVSIGRKTDPLPDYMQEGNLLTEEGMHAARAILTPEKIYSASKRGETEYKICLCKDSLLILSDEGRVTKNLEKKNVFAFLRKGLCDFSPHEKKLQSDYSENFGKNTFRTFLALFLTGKTVFDENTVEQANLASGVEKEVFKKHLSKLEAKGLLKQQNGGYTFTFKGKDLLPEPGDDTVYFRGDERNVLFVNKPDCTLCIHEQEKAYFIIPCEKIPWNAYIG